MMKLDESWKRLPDWVLRSMAVAMVGLIGWVDYITGWELSLFILYAVPILLLVWRLRDRSGLWIALLCGVVWFLANLIGNPYQTVWGYVVATFSRLAYFVFVAVGGAALRARRDADAATIAALERARELESEIVRISEREQRRIGQDLHDGLCQTLAAIGCAASSLKEDLRPVSEKGFVAADEIEDLLKNAVIEARSLARGISPVQMNESGLAAALDEFAEMSSHLMRVQVRFQQEGEISLADPQAGMHLYRIAQEAVNNAIRHGHASRVDVRLARDAEGLTLSVDDDGEGMKSSQRSGDGMGLRSMKYRAELLGASLKIGVAPSGGVQITCAVPAISVPEATASPSHDKP